MNASARFIALAMFILLGTLPHSRGADGEAFDRDTLGKLALEQPAASVLKMLGKPESKGKDEKWEAIGKCVQEWNYPRQGISVKMAVAEPKDERRVVMLTASGGCTLATSRGIKFCSTEAEVAKAYKDVRNAEDRKAGHTFVAGSVYGGVIFTISNGKVSEIFIGAAAE